MAEWLYATALHALYLMCMFVLMNRRYFCEFLIKNICQVGKFHNKIHVLKYIDLKKIRCVCIT